jgi:hypothetical protein
MKNTSLKWPVFIGFLAFYVLSYKPSTTHHEIYHYEIVKSWMGAHLNLSTDRIDLKVAQRFTSLGVDNKLYPKISPGLPLITIPALYLGRLIERIIEWPTVPSAKQLHHESLSLKHQKSKTHIDRRIDCYINQPSIHLWQNSPSVLLMRLPALIATSCSLWILYVLCLILGASVKRGVSIIGCLGLTTIIWPYATNIGIFPISTLSMLAVSLHTLSYQKKPTFILAIKISLYASLGLLVSYTAILWISIFYTGILYHRIYLYPQKNAQSNPSVVKSIMKSFFQKRLWFECIGLIFPLIISLIILYHWNQHVFGESWRVHQLIWGDHSVLFKQIVSSLVSSLIDLNHGLFIFSPLLCLALYVWRLILLKERFWGSLILLVCSTQWLFYSIVFTKKHMVHWQDGALLPLVPFLALSLAIYPFKKSIITYLWYVLIGIGLFIQGFIVLYPKSKIILIGSMDHNLYSRTSQWISWRPSQIWTHIKQIITQSNTFWWQESASTLILACICLLSCLVSIYLIYIRVQKLSFYIEKLKI